MLHLADILNFFTKKRLKEIEEQIQSSYCTKPLQIKSNIVNLIKYFVARKLRYKLTDKNKFNYKFELYLTR